MINDKVQIIKNMGIKWVLFRAKYEFAKKIGLLKRRFPAVPVTDETILAKLGRPFGSKQEFVAWWKANKVPFFFSATEMLEYKQQLLDIRNEDSDLIKVADDIISNKFLYYSNTLIQHQDLNWHWNPMLDQLSPTDTHWTEIPDLSDKFGDIKHIWELSRFTAVYYLVRAYSVTQDEKYAECFWTLFEHWEQRNPVEIGVNWKCSQELSLRSMSWLFGLYSFCDLADSTDDRIFKLIKQIYYHAEHINKHFDFALKSVRNNHTISEAAGMFTIGVVFPFFTTSKELLKKGKKYLESEGLRQIYTDGSYLQHSMNYQRLVVQTYSWCLRLGKLNGILFTDELRERIFSCTLFLYVNQNQETGMLPNYGMNDGALIHPLSCSAYLDYRPQLNAMMYILTGNRLYSNGKYDENLLWLCGKESLSAPISEIKRDSLLFESGGYYTIKSEDSHAMIRCTTYKDRPAQADMLHFDLWWKGTNILCDAGTYSYNTQSKWMQYFNGTSSHNTISINGKDQMKKGSRFVWYNWTKSKTINTFIGQKYKYFEGEHYGYNPLTHRRAIINYRDAWIIIDDVLGHYSDEQQELSQQWLFGTKDAYINDFNTVELQANEGEYKLQCLDFHGGDSRLYFGDDSPVHGWRSLYYGEKIPCYQYVRNLSVNKPVRLVTLLSPKLLPFSVHYDVVKETIYFDQAAIQLNSISDFSIVNVRELKKLEVNT